ncbi:AraC family transcriptional regulator ligand-binding domain-containing protein [Burkholderia savannae]|uniref:AraC family transcriptional regulator ligand-binding domain-containing protein n=1 Tax=Burkholderia savannae TaxID=1637837 RepID=UPI000AFCA667|nr:AraC family transcriptional regulator ligand-binding domain-containing protein [Burkholderia savannae]
MNRFAISPGWRILLADLDLSVDELLRRAQLPADLFARPDAGLSTREYFRLWQAFEDMAGEPSMPLPLRILDYVSVETFDPPIFAALCSPSLEVAVRRISQFKPLIGPLRLRVALEADALTLAIDFVEQDVAPPRRAARDRTRLLRETGADRDPLARACERDYAAARTAAARRLRTLFRRDAALWRGAIRELCAVRRATPVRDGERRDVASIRA